MSSNQKASSFLRGIPKTISKKQLFGSSGLQRFYLWSILKPYSHLLTLLPGGSLGAEADPHRKLHQQKPNKSSKDGLLTHNHSFHGKNDEQLSILDKISINLNNKHCDVLLLWCFNASVVQPGNSSPWKP